MPVVKCSLSSLSDSQSLTHISAHSLHIHRDPPCSSSFSFSSAFKHFPSTPLCNVPRDHVLPSSPPSPRPSAPDKCPPGNSSTVGQPSRLLVEQQPIAGHYPPVPAFIRRAQEGPELVSRIIPAGEFLGVSQLRLEAIIDDFRTMYLDDLGYYGKEYQPGDFYWTKTLAECIGICAGFPANSGESIGPRRRLDVV